MDNLTKDPKKLMRIPHIEYMREAGAEGIEMVMWLIMRGALDDKVDEVYRFYTVPASNTAVGHIILENRARGAKAAGKPKPAAGKHKRAAARAKASAHPQLIAIASEAKQSSFAGTRLDCFASAYALRATADSNPPKLAQRA